MTFNELEVKCCVALFGKVPKDLTTDEAKSFDKTFEAIHPVIQSYGAVERMSEIGIWVDRGMALNPAFLRERLDILTSITNSFGGR